MKPNIGKCIGGGLAGTVVMTLMMYFVSPMMGVKMDVAAMLGGMMGEAAPYNMFWMMGMGAHFLNGVVIFPLIYVFVLFGILPGAPWLKGLIWGLVLWLLSQTMMPIMMGMPMFGGGNMMAVMGSFVSHAIYGGLLGFIGGDEE